MPVLYLDVRVTGERAGGPPDASDLARVFASASAVQLHAVGQPMQQNSRKTGPLERCVGRKSAKKITWNERQYMFRDVRYRMGKGSRNTAKMQLNGAVLVPARTFP